MTPGFTIASTRRRPASVISIAFRSRSTSAGLFTARSLRMSGASRS